MTTKLDPEKITQLLNHSAKQLDSHTLSMLQQARAKAMQRQGASAHMLKLAGVPLTELLVPHSMRQWIVTGLLALVLAVGAGMWWQNLHHQQLIDTDVGLLTDELPIELFVD